MDLPPQVFCRKSLKGDINSWQVRGEMKRLRKNGMERRRCYFELHVSVAHFTPYYQVGVKFLIAIDCAIHIQQRKLPSHRHANAVRRLVGGKIPIVSREISESYLDIYPPLWYSSNRKTKLS
jgi:hypothetical protein